MNNMSQLELYIFPQLIKLVKSTNSEGDNS